MSGEQIAPLVTVVLPTVRGGRFLREAVESVVRQTEPRWELTIVSDGCAEPLTPYERSDRRIRVIRQQRSGVSIARNRAIAASSAPYIALLDDDDRMMPRRLERELAHFAEPATVLVHTQVDIIDDRGALLGHGSLHGLQYADLLRGDAGIITSSVMMRRSVLDAVGVFDPLLRAAEDLELYLRVARQGRLAFVDEPLAEYRTHSANQYSPPRVYQRDFVMIYSKHLNDALRDGNAEAAAAARQGIRRFAEWNATRAIEAARRVGPVKGVSHLIDAVRVSPGATFGRMLHAVLRRILPSVRS